MSANDYRVSYDLKDRALASAAEGITISDPSLPDNPLVYVNSGFTEITGYSAEEVLGTNCRFLQGPDTGSEASEEVRRAIAEDRPCVVELLNYRKDGSTFWNRLSITPVRNAAGKTTHYIGVQSDITRRKEAEDSLLQANEKLAAANAQMRRALNYAADIQQSLLPSGPLRAGGIYLVSHVQACDELAGDMLNYFALDQHRVGFYVLDVVGHGVPAALMSVAIHRLLSPHSGKSCLFESAGPEQKAARISHPAQVGTLLNELFSENIASGQFFTIFYGVWDASCGTLTYFSAGHPALVYLPADGTPRELAAEGFPIGVSETPEYQNHTLRLAKGDRVFIHSDGLTEGMNAQQETFDTSRVMRLIEQSRRETLDQSLTEIIDAAARFRDRSPVKDDISLLAFEVTG